MILDRMLQMSDRQAVTVSAASDTSIDTKAGIETTDDNEMTVHFAVAETVSAAGAATVTFALQDSADDLTYSTVQSSGAIGKATLKAGFALSFALPRLLRRYVRVLYTVNTGPLTAGRFTAYITLDVKQWRALPNGS